MGRQSLGLQHNEEILVFARWALVFLMGRKTSWDNVLGKIKEVFNEKRSEEIQASHAFFQETFQSIDNNCHMAFGHPRIKGQRDRTIANMLSHRKLA